MAELQRMVAKLVLRSLANGCYKGWFLVKETITHNHHVAYLNIINLDNSGSLCQKVEGIVEG